MELQHVYMQIQIDGVYEVAVYIYKHSNVTYILHGGW